MKWTTSVNDSAPPSFASVASKVSGWTTNLLATGLILVLALGVGRQLVAWWHVEPDQALPTDQLSSAGLDPTAPYTLEFGDSPFSIDERTVFGDRAAAVGQLLADCRQIAATSSLPAEPAGEAERKLLETVEFLEPLEVADGVRFYGPETGLPLLVAVANAQQGRPSSLPPGSAEASEKPAQSLPQRPEPQADGPAPAQLGAFGDRVLVWGMAASAGDQAWSLYTFRLGQRRATPAEDAPSVSLPPGSRRTMALRDARGETLLGFAGSEPAGIHVADEWRRSFAQEFERTGWSVIQDWQLAGDVWHARYARGELAQRWTVDVQFGPEPSGRLSGLVRIVPPAAANVPASRTEQELR